MSRRSRSHWIINAPARDLDRTAKFLLLSGYLTYRLTGRYIDSVGAQVGYIPFDYSV